MKALSKSSPAIAAALLQASRYQQNGLFNEAAQLYHTILQSSPSNAEANHQFGVFLAQRGNREQSLQHLRLAFTQTPAEASYAIDYIDALIATARADDARKALKSAMKHGLGSGVAEELQKRIKIISRQAGSAAPSSTDRIIALFNAGKYAEVEREARALLQSDPQSGVVWKILGVALHAQGKDSLEALAKAAALLPEDCNAQNNLGTALRERGQIEEAVAYFQKTLHIDPNFAEAHNNLGIALQDTNRLEDAVASYRRAIELKPGYAEPHNNLGLALRALGQVDDAILSYGRALEINRNFHQAHNNLGVALFGQGKVDEAIRHYEAAVKISPNYPEAYFNLGNAQEKKGQLRSAIENYRQALTLRADYLDAHNNLGIVLRKIGNMAEAEASFRQAIRIAQKPDDELYVRLAVALMDQGKLEAAEQACRDAMSVNPQSVSALLFMATLASDRGQFDVAQEWYRKVIAIDPDCPMAWANQTRLRKMTTSDTDWIAQAQRIASLDIGPHDMMHIHAALGKYFDDIKDFDKAFLHYRESKDVGRQLEIPYNREQQVAITDAVIRTYSKEWLDKLPGQRNDSSRPVFVVGMPRTGTSLVEQIIASHPAASGAGERPFWQSVAANDSSIFTHAPDASRLAQFGRDYLQMLNDFSSDSSRVVDKMPGNTLFLGLINAVFPNAHIIHMRRNPIDTCLSIYFQQFEMGHSYSYDLDDLAHYYREYLRIMRHWRTALPAKAMMEVNYEDLVSDQDAWSRKIIDFIDLPWDSACLDFQDTKRSVSTVSKWQVRQKIGTSSVERWRSYEKYVGPLMPLLDDSAST